MNKKTYVFGHQNPDTDSICSAIAYAYYKRCLGDTNVVAARLGALNRESNFALNKFNIKPPIIVHHIKPQVLDMNYYKVRPVYTGDSVKKAWTVMGESGKGIVPVLHQDHSLAGVVTLTDIAKSYLELTENTVLRETRTPFVNILSVLNGKIIYGEYPEPYVQGDIYTIAEIQDDSRLNNTDIILTGNNPRLIEEAVNTGAGCVIVTGVDIEHINVLIPKNATCAIVCVPDCFSTVIKMINQSTPIKNIMGKNELIFFETEDTIDEVKEIMLKSSFRHFPILNKDAEVAGLISKRHILDIQKKKVILVDHNENSQSALGIDQAEILEIIDHHRVANIDTQTPVFLRVEPVGCTCTIIAKMFNEANIMPPREIAGLMLSAILSDTLCFKSPTCTPEDIKVANRLAKIAEVDIMAYGEELISIGGALDKIPISEILEGDVKTFSLGEYKTLISQVNTTSLKSLEKIQHNLVQEMNAIQLKNQVDLVILIVTDILLGGSEIIAVGPQKKLAEKAFGIAPDKNSVYLEDVCSRKKQIIPQLTTAIQNI
ncbi:putative manganese-dependent inorganic diphosphatase [Candidatus Epulonipiscium viviparus]|uniref:putative manganese-dependent inorganic diphosphatase n=1 Tax=Candidatus Epulonipiscium viviparus TaxID=420336 RepID=UPI00016C089C|nr:putative manganese-dependent inorganic diphosphatase [Candidatus Epulopiscium viviparus]